MRSQKKRKRNRPQIRVLIVFGKGIATTVSFELAMLFCHAGFDVYSVYLDESGSWLPPLPIKQLTGHSPMSESHSPGWSQREQNFSLAIVINADNSIGEQINSGVAKTDLMEYVLRCSSNFILAVKDGEEPSINTLECKNRVMYFLLPTDMNLLSDAYNKLFAKSVFYLLNKSRFGNLKFCIRTSVNNDSTSSDNESLPLLELQNELIKKGLQYTDSEQANLLLDAAEFGGSSDDKSIDRNENALALTAKFLLSDIEENEAEEFVSDNTVLVRKDSSLNFKVYDSNGIRLLPDLSNQSAVSRLSDYLIDKLLVNMNRIVKLS